jgi:hypothetical protein
LLALSTSQTKCSVRGAKDSRFLPFSSTRETIVKAALPLTRTQTIAPRPGGEEMATMVSSSENSMNKKIIRAIQTGSLGYVVTAIKKFAPLSAGQQFGFEIFFLNPFKIQ